MEEWAKGPHRTVGYRFPKVPDYTDPEYDRNSFKHQIEAGEQRTREYLIAVTEVRQLRENLRRCILRTGINSGRECRDLSTEYVKRISCPGYVCPDDPRYEQMNPTIKYSDYRIGRPDNSLEREWAQLKMPNYDPYDEK